MGLFDRMKEVITVDISEKISYGTSIRKLAGEIKTNESEIRRLINQTGSRCVEKHLHETDTEYEDLFAEIRLLQDKNRSLSTQIQELKVQQAEEEQKRRQAREEMQLARQQEKASLKEQQPPLEETGKICTLPNVENPTMWTQCSVSTAELRFQLRLKKIKQLRK